MTYDVDWEGAYHAWKASKLSRQKFHYSEEFKKFILAGTMPSEDTVRTHFRRIRDKIEAGLINPPLKQFASEGKTEIEVLDSQLVTVINLDKNCTNNLKRAVSSRKYHSIRRIQQIVVRLPDGTTVEFGSANPELIVLQLLGAFKGERL